VSGVAWVVFLVAAAIGAPARYLLDGWVQGRTEGVFPWGTFAVNISGSFALGLLTGLVLYHGVSAETRVVLGTGGLGAFTTFSTLTFETVRLAEEGATDSAVRNAVASLALGVLAAAAGLGAASLL
jgi:CrcB protein